VLNSLALMLCLVLAGCWHDNDQAAPPQISSQPAAASADDGTAASFSVTASGDALSYRWQRNGVDIAGAGSAALALASVTLADNGAVYRVVVANGAGAVTSADAALTVRAVAPTVTSAPASAGVADGQAATFSVVAAGSAPLGFQWLRNGVAVAGATGSSYSLAAAALVDNGATFSVRVSNAAGNLTSSAAALTVAAAPPGITTQPQGQSVTEGQGASFSVAATGSAPLAYQWLRNGTAVAGATAAMLNLASTVLADTGAVFTVRVTNAAGGVTSNAATLLVSALPVAPQITAEPQTVTVTAGQTASFTVTATGGAPLAFQWRRNGNAIAGATATSYTTPPTTTADNGLLFSVVVSNGAGSVTSANVALTVQAAVEASGKARLAFGSNHVVALRADGSVIAWGSNAAGQLGTGAVIAGTNARQVATTAVAVAAGLFESLAAGGDGLVRGWGRKFPGTTIIGGDAATIGTDVSSPATGGWPGGVTHIVTGTGNSFALARRNDGSVWHMPGTATAIAGGLSQAARQVAGLPSIVALGGGMLVPRPRLPQMGASGASASRRWAPETGSRQCRRPAPSAVWRRRPATASAASHSPRQAG